MITNCQSQVANNNDEHALFHIHACKSPQRDTVHPFMFHPYRRMFILYVCLCASVYSVNSLIPKVAGIGEGLQLDSCLCDSLSSLGFDDCPIDVLL